MLKRFGKLLLLLSVAAIGAWKFIPWERIEQGRSSKIKNPIQNDSYNEYSQYVNEICKDFAVQMFKELELICEGDSGRMHEKVEQMGLQFGAYRRATIEEARALQIDVMHKFIDAINAHEKLRPFLEEYPFTHKRVMISIYFNGPNGCCTEGGLGKVSNYRNKLAYKTIDPFTGRIDSLFSESYEEAVQLAAAHPIENIATHQSTPLEDAIDDLFPDFVEQIAKQCKIRCVRLGGKITDRIETVEGKFLIFKHAYQAEARKVLLTLTERLLHLLNTNEQFKPYLGEYPFTADRLKIGVEFRQSNYCPYYDDSMESVVLEKGEVSYLRDYPMGTEEYFLASPVIATESYQDALNLQKGKLTKNGKTL